MMAATNHPTVPAATRRKAAADGGSGPGVSSRHAAASTVVDYVVPSPSMRRRRVRLRRRRRRLGPLPLLIPAIIATIASTPPPPPIVSDAAAATSVAPPPSWIGGGGAVGGVSWDDDGDMDVRHGNSTLFHGGPPAVFVDGRWCVYDGGGEGEDRPKKGKRRSLISGDDEVLGPFRGIEAKWSCPRNSASGEDESATPVSAAIKVFAESDNVLFEIHFPDGAAGTSTVDPDDPASSHDGVMAHFPALRPSPLTLPSVLSWEGSFVHSVRRHPVGPIGGGPAVFYDEGADPWLRTVVVGGPWDGSTSFKAFSSGNGTLWNDTSKDGYWTLGTSGRIGNLPPNYRQSILLHFGRGGITSTLTEWGAALRRSRAKARSSRAARGLEKVRDVTLERIGYQTDNGAYYCFCDDRNCSNTLLRTVEELRNQNVTLGYLSFQGKGASTRSKAGGAPWCVDVWGADEGGLGPKYPVPLKEFQKALGLPLQLYAPYFCPGSPYFGGDEDRGERSNWTSVSSDATLPRCRGYDFRNVHPTQSREFYDWFLDKGTAVGMAGFETDFMNQNHNCVPDFIHNVEKVDEWQSGMAEAAEASGVPIQWCYAAPTDVMASLDMPAVTNFRVSTDYCYGNSWNIGESSLLVWAVGGGAAPSKDTLWTTENGRTETPGCEWTPDHESPAGVELHLMLALMSTGPVGISDGMGMTNATLLLRNAISRDGTLLKPSRPITAIDSTFFSEGVGGVPSGSFVYGTSGAADSSWYFVSFKMREPHPVRVGDFWPPVFSSEDRKMRSAHLVHRRFDGGVGCVEGEDAVGSGCVNVTIVPSPRDDDDDDYDDDEDTRISHSQGEVVFSAPESSFVNVTGGSDLSPVLTTVWRACRDTGWVLLGELSKYVSLSPARFLVVRCLRDRRRGGHRRRRQSPSSDGGGVLAQVRGSPGEVVTVTALRPERGRGGAGRLLGLSLVVIHRSVVIPFSGEPVWIEFGGDDNQPKKGAFAVEES